MDRRYKAVIFDFGGVLLSYDNCQRWAEQEERYGIPYGSVYQNMLQLLADTPSLDKKLFTGEMSADELEDKILPDYLSRKLGVEFPRPFQALRMWIGPGCKIVYNDRMLDVVRQLRNQGYRTYIMTNNFLFDKEGKLERTPIDRTLFDRVVESTIEKTMKPERKFFEVTQKYIGDDVRPDECVFLDDLLANCIAGEEHGWTSIHVNPYDIDRSIEQLEEVLGTRFD